MEAQQMPSLLAAAINEEGTCVLGSRGGDYTDQEENGLLSQDTSRGPQDRHASINLQNQQKFSNVKISQYMGQDKD